MKPHADEKKLPSDANAEHIVLGCLILGNKGAAEVFEVLTPEDFYDSRNQIIFRALKSIWERNLKPELPMVMGDLDSSGKLETAGGIPYLAAMVDGIPGRTNLGQYEQKLKNKRILRELAHCCLAITNSVFDVHESGGEANDLVDGAVERLASISQMVQSEDRGDTDYDASASMLKGLDANTQLRIFTDIKSFDEITGGFRAGELIVLTADTGAGKSFLSLQIKRRACQDGYHALYCSGEMMAEHLMGRVVSSESQVPYWKIRRPEAFTKEERKQLMEYSGRQCKKCRTVDGELTLARIRSGARSMASNHELGFVIVDYDELVDVRGKDEWEQQRILVRALKSIGMQLGVPVLMVSQLRKAMDPADRKRPTLQRLYGSGAKSKHASLVMHVDRPYVRELKGNETEACIYILKNRDGRLGKIDCVWNVRTFRFEEAPPPEPEEN